MKTLFSRELSAAPQTLLLEVCPSELLLGESRLPLTVLCWDGILRDLGRKLEGLEEGRIQVVLGCAASGPQKEKSFLRGFESERVARPTELRMALVPSPSLFRNPE